MATGFCPALLHDINEVAGGNAPGRKLQIAGFLAMLFCCQDSLSNVINTTQYQDGQRRGATIKYRPRPLTSLVQTADNCDIDAIPAYSEWTVPNLNHAQVSFFLADDTVRQYCADSARVRASPGTPSTNVMQEVYGLIVEYSNTLMKYINQQLVIAQATQFGVNVSNNDNGGTLINFNTSGDVNILTNGLIQMMRDIQENEFCGTPCLVGGGLWSAQQMSQALACCNAAGVNFAAAQGLPQFFFDKDTQSLWGANSAGLFAPGSVKFISYDKYVDGYAGQKGTSFFTNFALPVNEFGCNLDNCLADLKIDMQLRYIDCPGNYDVNGVSTPLGRGWQVILSKSFGLFTMPTTGYGSGDSLQNTNGTIKYFASNTGYTGSSYSLY